MVRLVSSFCPWTHVCHYRQLFWLSHQRVVFLLKWLQHRAFVGVSSYLTDFANTAQWYCPCKLSTSLTSFTPFPFINDGRVTHFRLTEVVLCFSSATNFSHETGLPPEKSSLPLSFLRFQLQRNFLFAGFFENWKFDFLSFKLLRDLSFDWGRIACWGKVVHISDCHKFYSSANSCTWKLCCGCSSCNECPLINSMKP